MASRIDTAEPLKDRLYFLDGIRGWGALTVVLYHAYVTYFPIQKDLPPSLLSRIALFNGQLAVMVFFIASGFSLSIHYFRTKDRRFLIKLIAGRYPRLAFPVLAVSLLIYLAFSLHLIPPPDAASAAPTLPDSIRFALCDVFFDSAYSKTLKSLLWPLWSMRYELSGSIVLLLVLLAHGSSRFWWLLLPVIVVILKSKFYCALFIGTVFALLYAKDAHVKYARSINRLLIATAIPLVYLTARLPDLTPYGASYLFAATALTFFFIFHAPLSRLFSNAFSLYLGRISFTLYLIHAFVLYVFRMSAPYHVREHDALVNASIVLVSVLVAYLLQPADEQAKKLGSFFGTRVLYVMDRIKRPSHGLGSNS